MIINQGGCGFIFDDSFIEPPGRRRICDGYLAYCISSSENGKKTQTTVMAHRHAMRAQSGQIVDHINGNKRDNRLCNLRIVNAMESTWNRAVRGYTWNKSSKKWQATICSNGKVIYLGVYKTREEAQAAHFAASKVLRNIQPRKKEISEMSTANIKETK